MKPWQFLWRSLYDAFLGAWFMIVGIIIGSIGFDQLIEEGRPASDARFFVFFVYLLTLPIVGRLWGRAIWNSIEYAQGKKGSYEKPMASN